MMTKKRLTITDILKEKEKYQVKNDTKEELYIQRIDSTIVIKKPERSLCLESIEMSQDPNQSDDADIFLVYNTIVEPNLKDSELQKSFGCVEPTDIVDKIFEPGEIARIAQASLELSGYTNSVDKVKDLKN